MQQRVPTFYHRDGRLSLASIVWVPAGYDPNAATRPAVIVGIGQASLWANASQGLALEAGWLVRVEAIGECAATLLVTDVVAKSSLPSPSASSDASDSQGD